MASRPTAKISDGALEFGMAEEQLRDASEPTSPTSMWTSKLTDSRQLNEIFFDTL